MSVALGGEPLSQAELATLLDGDGDGDLVLLKGQWVEVDRDRLRQAIEHWEAVSRLAGDDGISFIEGMRLLAGASADLRHEGTDRGRPPLGARRRRRGHAGAAGEHAPAGRARSRGRRRCAAGHPPAVPARRRGVAAVADEVGLGACLADDMGLGKTIQGAGPPAVRPRRGRGPAGAVVAGDSRLAARELAPRGRAVRAIAGAAVPAPGRDGPRDAGGRGGVACASPAPSSRRCSRSPGRRCAAGKPRGGRWICMPAPWRPWRRCGRRSRSTGQASDGSGMIHGISTS